MSTVWKIRHKKTGLFSKGGITPRWSKHGKVWKQPGHLNLHFNDVRPDFYKDAEVIAFEMVEVYISLVEDFFAASKQRAEAREVERKERTRRFLESTKVARLQEYERLKKEFG